MLSEKKNYINYLNHIRSIIIMIAFIAFFVMILYFINDSLPKQTNASKTKRNKTTEEKPCVFCSGYGFTGSLSDNTFRDCQHCNNN